MNKPDIQELEPGEYYWCQCGLTQNGAFCDGSHITTDKTPMPIIVETKEKKAYCTCKESKNQPYCDGSHARN